MAQDIMKLLDGRMIAGQRSEITEDIAGRIGGAFAYWLGFKVTKNPYDLKICAGCDPVSGSGELKTALMKGITMFGAEPYDAGCAVTPAIAMAPSMMQFEFDGSVMVTAGSRADGYSGFRFFTSEGEIGEDDAAEILRLAGRYVFIGEYYEERPVNLMQMYAAHLRQRLSMELGSTPGVFGKMVFDIAEEGAGEHFARDVIQALGAKVSAEGADLGIRFNSDASEAVITGPDGAVICTTEDYVQAVIDAVKEAAGRATED